MFSSNQLKTMLQTQQTFFTTCWGGRFWLVQHHFYCMPNTICYWSSYESLLCLIIDQPMSHCHHNIKILNALNSDKVIQVIVTFDFVLFWTNASKITINMLNFRIVFAKNLGAQLTSPGVLQPKHLGSKSPPPIIK